MPDKEKVIKVLERYAQYPKPLLCDIVKDAITLIKEPGSAQVSQYWDDIYDEYVNTCECGFEWMSISASLVNYCPGCGKKVNLNV